MTARTGRLHARRGIEELLGSNAQDHSLSCELSPVNDVRQMGD